MVAGTLTEESRRWRIARHVFASVGALSSAGVVVAYYRPGLSDNTDWLGQLMVLGPAAAAMAMPFVLLGVLLRVPIVWAPCGLLMLAITAWTGADLLRGGEAMFGASLLVFALLFATSIVLVLIALAVDVPVRAVVRRRRAKCAGLGMPASQDC